MRGHPRIVLPCPSQIGHDNSSGEAVSMPTMQNPHSLPSCSVQTRRVVASNPFHQIVLGLTRIYSLPRISVAHRDSSTDTLVAGSGSDQLEKWDEIHCAAENRAEKPACQTRRRIRGLSQQSKTTPIKDCFYCNAASGEGRCQYRHVRFRCYSGPTTVSSCQTPGRMSSALLQPPVFSKQLVLTAKTLLLCASGIDDGNSTVAVDGLREVPTWKRFCMPSSNHS